MPDEPHFQGSGLHVRGPMIRPYIGTQYTKLTIRGTLNFERTEPNNIAILNSKEIVYMRNFFFNYREGKF